MKKQFFIIFTLCLSFTTAFCQVQTTPIDSTFYKQVQSGSGNSTEFTLKPTTTYDSIGIPVDVNRDLTDTLTLLPGTHAKLKLPRYFEPFTYEKFSGFLHKGTSTSILANEYQGMAYTTMTSQLTDSTFSKQGAELLETFDLKQVDGTPAKVFIMRIKTKTAPVIRIMYFAGNYQTTYNLIANIPEVVSNLIRNVILESFRTLEY
ncbi:MAG TPA: hypothetical protein PKH58_00510 [Paludibacteraceae bacterium]|nr:hypothetical protein [Paludibacteraceae bacterium]